MDETLSVCLSPLLAWYRAQSRDLPWRKNATPYRVWMSEIMLQQTRIAAVIPYFEKFQTVFPTVGDLAGADLSYVNKLWEGLGYYSRAKNLWLCAKEVTQRYGGEFPSEYEKLLGLPGVGSYTAGAIASIAFGLPEPAVDGNVLRVVMRLCGSDADISDEKVKREVRDRLRRIYPTGEGARALTVAWMELGQRICLPGAAVRCADCPLREHCAAYVGGIAPLLPMKKQKAPRRIEERTVFVITDERGRVAIRRRPGRGLLAGLYEFPNSEGRLSAQECADAVRSLGFSPLGADCLGEAKHVFTHIEWHMVGYLVRVRTPDRAKDFEKLTRENGAEEVRDAVREEKTEKERKTAQAKKEEKRDTVQAGAEENREAERKNIHPERGEEELPAGEIFFTEKERIRTEYAIPEALRAFRRAIE